MEKILATTQQIALHVERLRELLRAEYDADFAFVILARGHMLAANNAADGVVLATPKADVVSEWR